MKVTIVIKKLPQAAQLKSDFRESNKFVLASIISKFTKP